MKKALYMMVTTDEWRMSMERLTKHGKTSHENGICCTHFNSKECIEVQGNCAFGCKWEEEVWSKLAYYEDLEEQGRLIKLPFKVGTELYDITEFVEHYDSPDIYLIDASRIEISKDKEGLIYTIDGADYREKDFGTVLFTSEEEALKAISEKGWII